MLLRFDQKASCGPNKRHSRVSHGAIFGLRQGYIISAVIALVDLPPILILPGGK
jgi:hypothetical protein